MDNAKPTSQDKEPSAIPVVRMLTGGDALARLAAEDPDTLTPFQSAPWLAAYLGATGKLVEFRLAEISDAAGAAMLVPLVIEEKVGLRLAAKPGGGHAGFHMPWVRSSGTTLSPAAAREALRRACRQAGIDALLLADALPEWRGNPSPLLPLGQAAPDKAFFLVLNREHPQAVSQDRDERKKHRQKRGKLEAFGSLSAGWSAPETAPALLATLLQWKAAQFAAMKIADPFADPSLLRFLTSASEADGPLRLFTLRAGERPFAILAGAQAGRHFSGMVTAYDPAPEIARNSPGDLLMADLVMVLKREGFSGFDLGAGDARYKSRHCPEITPLFDVAIGVSWRGALAALLWLAARRIKGVVKRRPVLLEALRRLRGG